MTIISIYITSAIGYQIQNKKKQNIIKPDAEFKHNDRWVQDLRSKKKKKLVVLPEINQIRYVRSKITSVYTIQ